MWNALFQIRVVVYRFQGFGSCRDDAAIDRCFKFRLEVFHRAECVSRDDTGFVDVPVGFSRQWNCSDSVYKTRWSKAVVSSRQPHIQYHGAGDKSVRPCEVFPPTTAVSRLRIGRVCSQSIERNSSKRVDG